MTTPEHGSCRKFLEALKDFSRVSEWSLEQCADFWDIWIKVRDASPEHAKASEFGPLPVTAVPEPKRKQ